MSSQVKTECGNCVFYGYYDGPICMMDRIDIFDELGQVKFEKDLPVIQRLCNTCRNQESIDKVYPKLDIVQVKQKVRESVIPKVDIIVLVNSENYPHLKNTLTTIRNMDILPTKVIFAITDNTVKAQYVYKQSREISDIIPDVSVLHLFKNEFEQHEVISDCFRKCTSFFVSLFDAGYSIPSNFINQLDEMMNTNLMYIPLVTNSDGSVNGTTICRSYFQFTGTYEGLVDGIRAQLKEEGKQEIVWNPE